MITHKLALGGETTVRFALNDKTAVQFETWLDLSNNVTQTRWGISSAGIYTLNDSSDFRFGLMSVGALCFDGT
jgi:hypothetical protein